MQRALFAGHPYGAQRRWHDRHVAAIARDDVVDSTGGTSCRATWSSRMAGDVTADHAASWRASSSGPCPRACRAADDVPEPTMRPGRRLLVVDKPERTQTQILVGTMGTSPHDEDHVPLVVANAVFGGTFTSRLMREVRSKRGWSYGASARTAIDRHRQAWIMWTFPAAEDAAPCLS